MLKRISSPFIEYGWATGALYICNWILQSLSHRLALRAYELVAQPIPGEPLLPARRGTSIEVRLISRFSADIERLPVRSDVIGSRFAQGAVCLGAYRKGELIGYVWICRDRYEEDEVRCTYSLSPAGQAVFDFDFYIYPEHRAGLAFSGLWNGVNRYLREHRIEVTFSRITRFNVASRRAHARLGSRKLGDAVFFQAWSVEIMLATIAPFFHLSMRRGNRVTLHLASGVELADNANLST